MHRSYNFFFTDIGICDLKTKLAFPKACQLSEILRFNFLYLNQLFSDQGIYIYILELSQYVVTLVIF